MALATVATNAQAKTAVCVPIVMMPVALCAGGVRSVTEICIVPIAGCVFFVPTRLAFHVIVTLIARWFVPIAKEPVQSVPVLFVKITYCAAIVSNSSIAAALTVCNA